MGAARGELPEGVGWRIDMHNEIPIARGLGSSAAATVGGIVAANALLGGPLDTNTQLRIAAGIEGHPDNAAAALLGGFVASAATADGIEAIRIDALRDLRAVLFIPDRRLATDAMRKALPASVPYDDAVANLGAVALGVAGLATGRTDLLTKLTVDRMHEPYRAAAYPEFPRMVAAAREAGAIGACLSGAGSSILAFADSMAGISRGRGGVLGVAADVDLDGRVVVVEPRNMGRRSSGRRADGRARRIDRRGDRRVGRRGLRRDGRGSPRDRRRGRAGAAGRPLLWAVIFVLLVVGAWTLAKR